MGSQVPQDPPVLWGVPGATAGAVQPHRNCPWLSAASRQAPPGPGREGLKIKTNGRPRTFYNCKLASCAAPSEGRAVRTEIERSGVFSRVASTFELLFAESSAWIASPDISVLDFSEHTVEKVHNFCLHPGHFLIKGLSPNGWKNALVVAFLYCKAKKKITACCGLVDLQVEHPADISRLHLTWCQKENQGIHFATGSRLFPSCFQAPCKAACVAMCLNTS